MTLFAVCDVTKDVVWLVLRRGQAPAAAVYAKTSPTNFELDIEKCSP